MNTPRRIIDANANRVREALRVLEEAARFVLESESLADRLKRLRHDFVQALPSGLDLVAHRDTPGDVGTGLSTAAEQSRQTMGDVIAAAGSRLSEALRVIEEYSKLDELGPGFGELARVAEQTRYHGYELTQWLQLAATDGRSPQWRMCLLLTHSLCTHHDWKSVLEQALDNGVDCVQVREKEMDSGPLLEHIRAVIKSVDGRAHVIVNDRPDLALLAGADGVHMGQTDVNPLDARRLLGEHAIIGVSTSNLEQAKAAKASGANYCGVGPMFPTTTKHKLTLAGPGYLREYLGWNGLPHLAIGGITPDNVGELVAVGCRGIAVSSAICSSKEPAVAAKQLFGPLNNAAAACDSQASVGTDA